MKGAKLWVIAFFVVINNGCSLLGNGERSVGGVARAIESRTEMASATALQRAQKVNAGDSPPQHEQLFPAIFKLANIL